MGITGHSLRITVAYKAQYTNPITVNKGEKVSIGREDDEYPGWRWCGACDGGEGWVPVELLSHESGEAMILQDYSSRELTVLPDERVVLEDARHGWLLVRTANGERGWIPAQHAEKTCD